MRSRIIDGEEWLERKREHLLALLDANPMDAERDVLEAELRSVDEAIVVGCSGPRHSLRRWFRRRRAATT